MKKPGTELPPSPYRDPPVAHAEPYPRCAQCNAWIIPDRAERTSEALREHQARCQG